jgi:hypothetical protein
MNDRAPGAWSLSESAFKPAQSIFFATIGLLLPNNFLPQQ